MRPRSTLAAVGIVSVACFGGGQPTASGPVRCERPADGSASFGCAVINGTVVGPTGAGLSGVSGAIRASLQCGCRGVPIDVDSLGRFSVTVHRSESRAQTSPDTATILIYMGATAPKYPRSVTGDAYFDTSSVHLTYAPVGAEAAVYTLGMRIPLPTP
ncbi:MAG TPA: hypothetical protein VM076_11825 [Gemmatimonadaceae bacterium]|nr:hypothetical protein [Gemmatimonadaceae bacterium]